MTRAFFAIVLAAILGFVARAAPPAQILVDDFSLSNSSPINNLGFSRVGKSVTLANGAALGVGGQWTEVVAPANTCFNVDMLYFSYEAPSPSAALLVAFQNRDAACSTANMHYYWTFKANAPQGTVSIPVSAFQLVNGTFADGSRANAFMWSGATGARCFRDQRDRHLDALYANDFNDNVHVYVLHYLVVYPEFLLQHHGFFAGYVDHLCVNQFCNHLRHLLVLALCLDLFQFLQRLNHHFALSVDHDFDDSLWRPHGHYRHRHPVCVNFTTPFTASTVIFSPTTATTTATTTAPPVPTTTASSRTASASTTTSTTTTAPATPTDASGRCVLASSAVQCSGLRLGPGGQCCSQYGWCGTSAQYCKFGCKSQCNKRPIPKLPKCDSRSPNPSPTATTPSPPSDGTGVPGSPNRRCILPVGASQCSVNQLCPSGMCCSQYGWCGISAAYCGRGCLGQCNKKPVTGLPSC
ncbi:hypothetical protein H9P43_002707 [Blastocladiella emersonii ATCC 22665]|nr:hypothetical protein H9P43_002707 [Blastocladiella emersonii ATCC 22665]